MAGDWIKIQTATVSKPEVLRLARMLGVTTDDAIGKLVRFWAWVDGVSVDGVVDGVVDADVDAVVGANGFCDGLTSVGWLIVEREAEQIRLPNFERHNGDTAKNRAQKAKRQSEWRGKARRVDAVVDAPVDGVVDARRSTRASTREEKRREEKNTCGTDVPHELVGPVFPCSGRASKDGTRPSYQAPQSLVDQMIEAYPGVDVLGQLKEAALWCTTNAAKRKTKEGMPRFLNSWMARQQDRGNRSSNGRTTTTTIGPIRNPFGDLLDDEDS